MLIISLTVLSQEETEVDKLNCGFLEKRFSGVQDFSGYECLKITQISTSYASASMQYIAQVNTYFNSLFRIFQLQVV